MLDAVVISDLHLGSRACRADALAAFLGDLPPTRRLVLNGDVVDGTFRPFSLAGWRVLTLLQELSWRADTTVYWVAGNHDRDAADVARLAGATWMTTSLLFESGGRWVACEHGDRHDDFILRHPRTARAADWAYRRLQGVSTGLAAAAKRRAKAWTRNCDRVRAGALALWPPPYLVLCGHTHRAEAGDHHAADGHYWNSGCWTEPVAHYLTVLNGTVDLKEYRCE